MSISATAGSLRVAIGEFSDPGRKQVNQDAHGVHLPPPAGRVSKGVALALADGISSSEVSGEASAVAVRAFLADYFSTPETWSVRESAQRVLMATNAWLYAQTRRSQHRDDLDRGYVCTLSAVVIKSTVAHVFHVGDSRVHLLRGGMLEQLTDDHRLRVSRERSYLSRALGIATNLEIDYRRRELEAGDVLLLTTDGIHEYVTSAGLAAIVSAAGEDLQAAARAIAAEAHRRGSPDNLTVQLIRVDSLPPPGAVEALWRAGELPLPSRLHPGTVLDGYRIVRELHASHRSHVWLAEDENAGGRPVILKTPAVDVQHDRGHLNRLLLEEWIARRVDNPHVLKAPPETRSRQSLYTVSEYVDGRTLAQWMRENPRPTLDTVRGIVEQIVAGLRALHRKGVLHQDLRPENILIDADGKVTLIDLGAACVAGIGELGGAARPSLLGTEQYSAPECFLGAEGSIQSELFSLGVITYQMLTGRLPFGAQVAGIRSQSDLLSLRYQPAPAHNADVPVWLDSALCKAVQARPERRHAALSEFVFELRHPQPHSRRRMASMRSERHPALFWKVACFLLLLLNLGLLVR